MDLNAEMQAAMRIANVRITESRPQNKDMKRMEEIVLCGASSYTKKFYLNPEFQNLPDGIKDDLKIMCVVYTSEVSGSIELVYNEDGELEIRADHKDEDALFDEIGSYLLIRRMQRERTELFEALELYYKAFVLKEEIPVE